MERVNFHSDLKRSVLCNLLVIYIVALVSVEYFELQWYDRMIIRACNYLHLPRNMCPKSPYYAQLIKDSADIGSILLLVNLISHVPFRNLQG